MEPSVPISSDFHPFQKVESSVSPQYYSSKIPVFITKPLPINDTSSDDKSDDDVLDLPRPDFFVNIRFAEKTDLPNVGLQIWNASLALCDHLAGLLSEGCPFSSPPFIDGTVFLELGCGVGLPSLVLSKGMTFKSIHHTVFMTDIEGPALENARFSAGCIHKDSLKQKRRRSLSGGRVDLRVRALDWMSSLSRTSFRKWRHELLSYGWTTSDAETLEAAVISGKLVVLAADPVYDEAFTEGLVGVLCELAAAAPKLEILLSLERRINFIMGDIKPRAVHYDHFWNELRGRSRSNLLWEKVPLFNPPRHVPYQYNQNIELWRIYIKEN